MPTTRHHDLPKSTKTLLRLTNRGVGAYFSEYDHA